MQDKKEPKYVDGLFVKPPHEKAPDFVKARISMKREELLNWLSEQSDEWVNLDVKSSSKDAAKWYAQVNDWKPEKKNEYSDMGLSPDMVSRTDQSLGFEADIPF